MSLLSIFDGGASDRALDATKASLNELKSLNLPQLKQLYPELYQTVVSMNPELETAVSLGPSAMEGVSTDPRLRQAQLNALQKLQGISEANGMDAQFQADNARLQNDLNANLRGNQEAIIQNMATRGLSGGTTEMLARQNAAQQSANRQAQMGLDIQAQAQRRALEALMNSGNMASQMQSNDFNQQSAKAQAQDAINKFNAANSQQVMANNVQARNQAQQMNMQNRQNIANQNTQLRNQTNEYNTNGLAQQQYENELKKKGIISGGYNQLSNQYNQQSQANAALTGALISAGAKAYAGGA